MAAKRTKYLRGSTLATIDEQGRLKIPTMFKDILVQSYGVNYFVTSLTGENVFVYPLTVWEALEERLTKTASLNSSKRRLLNWVNYYGMEVTMDKQGRILIPATLRDSATIVGELRVLGATNHLEVWNEDRFRKQPALSETDLSELADLGI